MTSTAPRPSASARSDAAAESPPAFACSHCVDCGYNNFPPSDVCPKCWSDAIGLQALAREGVLYSFSTGRIGDAVGFVGYVDLPDSVRVFGRLSTKPPERPTCGLRVRLSHVQASGNGPCFVFDVLDGGSPE